MSDMDTRARVEELEDAITEVSLLLCEDQSDNARAAMRIFGKVMDADARKRMGI